MSKVAVAILNWNGKELLEEFLPSVVKYSLSDNNDVYVIDNGSTDDSVIFTRSNFPQVKLVVLDKNYGFAEGYNIGLKQIRADYYVLLNSDVEVTPGWITPVTRYLDSNPGTAACQPKILSYHNKKMFEYAGAAGGFIDKFGFPFCQGRLFNVFETDTGQYDEILHIFWASGACMFIRSDLYKSCGGLDSSFFAHMEEIDLCWRLQSRGYNIAYIPQSSVFHVGGATLSKANPHKTFLNFRNSLYLLYKNLPKNKIVSVLFIRMILDGIAAVKFLFGLEFSNFYAVVKAHFTFWFTFRRFAGKRRENIELMKQSRHATIYNKSIVYAFFIKKIKYFKNLGYRP